MGPRPEARSLEPRKQLLQQRGLQEALEHRAVALAELTTNLGAFGLRAGRELEEAGAGCTYADHWGNPINFEPRDYATARLSEPERKTPTAETDVSIIVPAWGAYAGSPLREAIATLLEQDVPARIIIVENASVEPLPEFEGVEVVRAPRRLTVGAARNLGLERVTTPYVLFWDADDLMLPGTLRFLRERIRSDPRLVAVAAAIVQDEPRVRHRWPPSWSARLARHPRFFALCHAIWGLFPTTGATIIRTAAVRDSKGYADANSGEDWVLGVSLAFRGWIELHERPGRVYRRLGESLWERRRSRRHLLAHAAAVRRRIFEDPGVPSWLRPAIPLLAVLQAIVVLGLAPLARAVRGALRPSGGT
jgi:Glycosyl transferase family 2